MGRGIRYQGLLDMTTRREVLRSLALAAGVLALPASLTRCARPAPPADAEEPGDTIAELSGEDQARLIEWTNTLRSEGLVTPDVPIGRSAVRVGELAAGTPYEAFTLEAYIRAGGSPSRSEPLTLSLTRFDCVSLVEACLAIPRAAAAEVAPSWERFAREMERMRYRGGERTGYSSRLHYFSEWISDGAERGLLRDIGQELGGEPDTRPLRFMSANPGSYPALADENVLREIAVMERSLDGHPRYVVPTARIQQVDAQLQTGDVVAFATSIEGLDVSHAAFAYRGPAGVMRVLHAPLSGGVVEVTSSTLHQYVVAIRRATGILVARPAWG